jgi:nucleotide-binding universal stress UspA family protein
MKILIATDGSEFSLAAVDAACRLLNSERAEFKVVSVADDVAPFMVEPAFSAEIYDQWKANLRAAAQANIAEAEKRIVEKLSGTDLKVTSEVLDGFPDKEILRAAKAWDADVIVVGSHGRGFWGRLLGSVSTGVLHHAPCAVLVVRMQEAE